MIDGKKYPPSNTSRKPPANTLAFLPDIGVDAGVGDAFPIVTFSNYHIPRRLVEEARLKQSDRDIRIASLFWFQPSLVFYSQREVEKLESPDAALDRLEMKASVYLIVPEPIWNDIQRANPKATRFHIAARQFDFHKNYNVLVITNEPLPPAGMAANR